MNVTSEIQPDFLTHEQFMIIEGTVNVFRILVSVFGIFGNMVDFVTLLSMGFKDGLALSMIFLAFVQLLHVLAMFARGIAFVFFIAEYACRFRKWFPVDPYGLYILFGHIGRIPYMMSVLTTMFLSFARCMCVSRPIQFKNLFTVTRWNVVMCVIVMISAGSYAPLLKLMAIIPQFDPKINSTRSSLWISPDREGVKGITWIIRNAALPLTTQAAILICVIQMSRNLLTSAEFRNRHSAKQVSKPSIFWMGQHPSNKLMECTDSSDSAPNLSGKKIKILKGKELQVIQQMVLISIVVIVCDMPEILISFFTILWPTFGLTKPLANFYLTLIGVNHLFQTVNSSVGCIIHWRYSSQWRKHCCLAKKVKVNEASSIPSTFMS